MDTEKRYDYDNDKLVTLTPRGENYLPSVEVRETLPEFRDEIDLRDLLDVLVRRRWSVIAVLLLCFFTVAIYTFSVTPQFKAKGVLKVSSQSSNLTKFDNLESTALKTMEFQETQVKLLQSEQLAGRVIDALDLTSHSVFNPELSGSSGGKAYAKGVLATIKGFVRAKDDEDGASLPEEVQRQLLEHKVLSKFNGRFSVSPVKNSELVEVKFETPDPTLSAAIVNSSMEEFINMHMDSNLKASQDAARFLNKQIEVAQIKLEKSEMELQSFARDIGVVSLSPKLNLVLRQLEELNEALAKARSNRIAMEARYQQYMDNDRGEFVQVIDNELIQELKSQHAILNAEYQDLSITFKPGYPKMLQLKARMDELQDRIDNEKARIVDSIRNDYETALKTERFLDTRTAEQKQRALDLEKKATQYKIYEREVDTNKSIYQSLLQRSKEIEATVGAAVSNIQIVDSARPPLYPYKPRVAFNLLVGIIIGLVGGIGTAFIFEYFDNTIKNPDELSDRFQIPVLGLIPFDKEAVDNRKLMALKFYTDPRSPVAEAFRTTMTSVRLSVADNQPKSILITSILPGAGKSSLSSNSCLSYLAEDERCLLIDVDLRKPSLHKIFSDGEKSKGLSSVLSGMAKLSEVIQQTDFPDLDFISSGPLPPNPAELLSSKRMRQLLEMTSRNYDRVILDGPPFQGFAEILVLSNMVDGVILVAAEGDTPREGVKHFRKSITNVGGRLLGAILNKSGRKKGFSSYGGYKYYSYNYDYGEARDS